METRALKRQRLAAEAENELKETTRDRISDLPDPIIHNILSLLPIESAARTSLLSKQWAYLWRCLPILDFSSLTHSIRKPGFQNMRVHNLQIKATELLVLGVLSRRHKDSNLKVFRLVGHVSYSLLNNCIRRLLRLGVEELELNIYFLCSFALPRCFFTCNNKLRVLKLNPKHPKPPNRYSQPMFIFQMSLAMASDCFQFVHTLSLTWTRFTGCSSTIAGFFSARRFPVLKSLCLRICRGLVHLNINCPCLESLELDGTRLTGLEIYSEKLQDLEIRDCFNNKASFLTIFAPRVENFTWVDNDMVEKCSMDNFKCNKNCTIQFPTQTITKAKLQSAASLISILSSAAYLHAGSQVIEICSDIDSSGGLPCSFNNLVTLELRSGFNKYEFPGIACLLRRTPILHALTIEGDIFMNDTFNPGHKRRDRYVSEEDFLESQAYDFRSFEHHLKLVRIRGVCTEMLESALSLVKLLVGHGRVLERMTLTTVDNTTLQKISSQIQKFPKASPNVNIVLFVVHGP